MKSRPPKFHLFCISQTRPSAVTSAVVGQRRVLRCFDAGARGAPLLSHKPDAAHTPNTKTARQLMSQICSVSACCADRTSAAPRLLALELEGDVLKSTPTKPCHVFEVFASHSKLWTSCSTYFCCSRKAAGNLGQPTQFAPPISPVSEGFSGERRRCKQAWRWGSWVCSRRAWAWRRKQWNSSSGALLEQIVA